MNDIREGKAAQHFSKHKMETSLNSRRRSNIDSTTTSIKSNSKITTLHLRRKTMISIDTKRTIRSSRINNSSTFANTKK